MKKNSGFTLIELLIVITIIGVLATIILNALSESRSKAYDAKVKQQLSGFRTAAEMYFTNQNGYGVNGSCSTGIFVNLNAVDGSPGRYIQTSNLPSNTVVVCGSTDSAYAVKATLYTSNTYWCVDSKGTSKLFSGAIGSSAIACQ